jgi:hypothetical protein
VSPLVEPACLVIVLGYLVVQARREPSIAAFLQRILVLAIASWLGEDSVMHAYGFYAYAPTWSVVLDRTPLLITLIWPVVIDSAWRLARQLTGEGRATPLAAAAIILADASLIEPVAVRFGLWTWSEPGVFHVPPIGILGWAFFGGSCLAVFPRSRLATPVLAPLATHVLLLASWWGALRWVSGPEITPWAAVGLAWMASIAVTVALGRRRPRAARADLLVRIPGAVFFFVLLAAARAETALWAYALAFVPPYLALLGFSGGASA